eukprot:scaffold26915_cov57-Phaeocystis_antarctica.AAC.1
MTYMSVTLDVSKNSGWLNDDACCRVERRGHTIGGERCGMGDGSAWGNRGARSMHGGRAPR